LAFAASTSLLIWLMVFDLPLKMAGNGYVPSH